MTVLKWTIFFKNQSFEHDIIIYNFVALSVFLCLYHRDLISKVYVLIRFVKRIKHKKEVQNVYWNLESDRQIQN